MALTRITQGVIKPNENYDTHNINSTGIVTATGLNISGNASIGGVLTYEDVTNIDSVGIITARAGVRVNADGSTSSNYMSVGASDDLKIYHDSNNSYIKNTGAGELYIDDDGGVNLQRGGNTKLYTDISGVGVLGNVDATGILAGEQGIRLPLVGGVGITTIEKGQASFTGIVTASSFKLPDGSNVGGIESDAQFNTVGGSDAATNRTHNAYYNSIFGYQAGKSIFHSDGNTAIGYKTLENMASGGNYNTCIGEGAGKLSLNASYNAFLGSYSGSNCDSEWNVALGYQTLSGGSTQVTGGYNVALGARALYNISSGTNNVGIGYGVGYGNNGDVKLISGSNNILIGFEAAPTSTSVSNEITLGNSSITNFRIPGVHIGITANATSLPAAIFRPGVIQETYHNDTGGGMQSNYTHSILTYGMVWYGVTNAVGSWTFNIQGDASTTFNSLTSTGKVTTMTMYSANNSTSNYMTAFKIDGTTQTVKWAGGSAPSEATGSGVDVYSMTIMKTGSNTYHVFGNVTNFA